MHACKCMVFVSINFNATSCTSTFSKATIAASQQLIRWGRNELRIGKRDTLNSMHNVIETRHANPPSSPGSSLTCEKGRRMREDPGNDVDSILVLCLLYLHVNRNHEVSRMKLRFFLAIWGFEITKTNIPTVFSLNRTKKNPEMNINSREMLTQGRKYFRFSLLLVAAFCFNFGPVSPSLAISIPKGCTEVVQN